MRRIIFAFILIVACGSPGFTISDAFASCSVIPREAFDYPSEIGSVDRVMAGPGAAVAITLNPACDCASPHPCNFNSATTAEVVFGTKVIAATFVQGTPTQVSVTIPQSENPSTAPVGLAGPVQILVKGGGQTLAHISTIYQPTNSCDRVEDKLFNRFIALPRPTNINASPKALRGAFDERGNLLLPLRHVNPSVSPDGSATAEYERGGGWLDLRAALLETQQDGKTPMRAFDLRGRPLPPLLFLDDLGGLFGTADSRFSVLQIGGLTGSMGESVRSRLRQTQQPPMTGAVRFIDSDLEYKFEKCFPVVLDGTEVSSRMIAFPRDERLKNTKLNLDSDKNDRVTFVNSPQFGAMKCGTNTEFAVSESGTKPMRMPVLVAGGRWAALFQDEKMDAKDVDGDGNFNASFVRVFDRNGNDATVPPVPLARIDEKAEASPDAQIFDGRSMSVEDPIVYFLSKSGPTSPLEIRAIDASQSTLRSLKREIAAADTNSNYAAWLSNQGRDAFLYDAANDMEHDLATTATRVAIGEELLALAAPTTGSDRERLRYLEFPIADESSISLKTTSTTAADIAVDGKWIVFLTDEARAKIPTAPLILNGDNDTTDRVIRFLTADGQIHEIEQAATDFAIADGLVVFRTLESDQTGGTAPPTNNDGDDTDHILQVYDLAAGVLRSTGQAATIPPPVGVKRLAPYRVAGRNVYFFTKESDQDEDIDKDGDKNDTVLRVFNVDSQSTVPELIVSAQRDLVAPVVQNVAAVRDVGSGPVVRFLSTKPVAGRQSRVTGDFDGDGSYDAVDLCIADADPRQTDADCDQLGEGAGDAFEGLGCDSNLCTDFVANAGDVPSIPDDGCVAGTSVAAQEYMEARVRAVSPCLTQLIKDRGRGRSADADVECRGYFVEGSEVLPQDPDTAEALRVASQRYSAVFEKNCGAKRRSVLGRAGDTIRRIHAETANAATWVAFGSANLDPDRQRKGRGFDDAALECQLTIAELIEDGILGALMERMRDCIRGPVTSREVCLARISGGKLSLPSGSWRDDDPFEHWASKLGSSCRGFTAAPLGACADTPDALVSCMSCTIARRASEATLSLGLLEKRKAQRLARAHFGSDLGLACGLP